MPKYEYRPDEQIFVNLDSGARIDPVDVMRQNEIRLRESVINAISNDMTDDELFSIIRAHLRNAYVQNYLLSIGGRNSMTMADWGRLGGQLNRQYEYLRDMLTTRTGNPALTTRASNFINSATQAFWRGRADRAGVTLPAYPGDGSTICRSNCACSWRLLSVGDTIEAYWQLSAAEHCETCLARAQDWNPHIIQL